MEHSPSCEDNSRSVGKINHHILWKAKLLYRVHKDPPPVPTQGRTNSVHTLILHSFKIHYTIHPSTLWSFNVPVRLTE
jgi:hypothetical protein